MLKITQDKTVVLQKEEAIRLVKKLGGNVRFQVCVTTFLPTEDNRGFDGITFITVSKKEFLSIVDRIIGDVLIARGAKVRIKLSAPSNEMGLSFVSLM